MPCVLCSQIENNDLSGSIPEEWALSHHLTHLLVRPGNDRMCGPTPANLSFQRKHLATSV